MTAPSGSELRFDGQSLNDFAARIFRALGMPEEDANITADVLANANLRGVDTHGLDMLPIYVDRLRQGVINPCPAVRTVRQGPSMAVLDADRAAGQVASVRAMRLAMDKARDAGVGWVNVVNSSHQGALAYYALMAVEQDMIGVTVSTTSKVMAPWGSREPIAPNTPMAFALPSAQFKPPVLDMATSVLAFGNVRLAAERGAPIPAGLALDAEGNATVDPAQAKAAISFGAYKGSGLMFVFSVLAGLLGGGPFIANKALKVGQGAFASQVSHCFVAIDVARFTDVGAFKTGVDDVIVQWKESARRPGFDTIYYPGEIEWICAAERERDGIPLHDTLVRELRGIGAGLGVAFPAPAAVGGIG